MEKFTTLKGISAPFPDTDINTDIIYPARFLKTIQRSGLEKYLFNSLRYDLAGRENPGFILNKEPYRQAKIIIAGKNFAGGSSREHAVWSLMDFGIRCVIAESFGDIFYNNSYKNGLLLIKLDHSLIQRLLECASSKDPALAIHLPDQVVRTAQGENVSFDIDPFIKARLINGADDISITLQNEEKIAAFESRQKENQPWLYS
jgi:3-isopropylmalate/(R)-2-methylmalate dehydratase small subunit